MPKCQLSCIVNQRNRITRSKKKKNHTGYDYNCVSVSTFHVSDKMADNGNLRSAFWVHSLSLYSNIMKWTWC